MTVSATPKRKDYTGDGLNSTFGYNWRILYATDLKVITRSLAGIETTLTYGTDYTLTGVGDVNGGNVLMLVAPTAGVHITILPNLVAKQSYSFRNQADYYGSKHEDALDYLAMCLQMQAEVTGRSIVLPASFTTSGQLTNPVPGYALGVSADGQSLVFVPNTGADQYASLADFEYPLNGAGRIGYNDALTYAAGTVGKAIKTVTDRATSLESRATVWSSSGTAPNFTLTPAPALAAYVDGIELEVKLHTVNGTTQPTLNVNGLGVKNWMERDSSGSLVPARLSVTGVVFRVVYDGTQFVTMNPLPPVGAASIPVRQTVHSGPMDTAGLPTFLPATASGLSITSQNISGSAPLCATGALGYDAILQQINTFGRSTSNLTWSGLTNGATNYLYVTINADGTLTPGSTTLAPVYQPAGTPSTTNGQHTFNWNEMKMYVGNGSTAGVVNRVFVGEAVTSGGNVTSAVAYAYNGTYDSGWTATLPTTATKITKSHNLGVPPRTRQLITEVTTADGNYAVGQQIENWATAAGSGSQRNFMIAADRNSMQFTTGDYASWLGVNANTGGLFTPTLASHKYKLVAGRGW